MTGTVRHTIRLEESGGGESGGGLTPVFIDNADSPYAASDGELLLVDSNGGVVIANLPASPTSGQRVSVYDVGEAAATNNITIGRNGETIDSVAEDFVFDVDAGRGDFIYNGTTWELSLVISVGSLTEEDVDARVVAVASGKQSVWIPVAQMFAGGASAPGAEVSIGSAGSSGQFRARPFDPDAAEALLFSWAIPPSMDDSVAMTYEVYWAPANTNTGTVFWQLQHLSLGDGDAIDQLHSAEAGNQVSDAANGTINDLHITGASGGEVISGAAAGELVSFRFARRANSGGDTFTGDAYLIGIMLHYTTDAPTDDAGI